MVFTMVSVQHRELKQGLTTYKYAQLRRTERKDNKDWPVSIMLKHLGPVEEVGIDDWHVKGRAKSIEGIEWSAEQWSRETGEINDKLIFNEMDKESYIDLNKGEMSGKLIENIKKSEEYEIETTRDTIAIVKGSGNRYHTVVAMDKDHFSYNKEKHENKSQG